MDECIVYTGLDVHKTISVAFADGGSRGGVREHGKISNAPVALACLLSKLDLLRKSGGFPMKDEDLHNAKETIYEGI